MYYHTLLNLTMYVHTLNVLLYRLQNGVAYINNSGFVLNQIVSQLDHVIFVIDWDPPFLHSVESAFRFLL